MPSLCKVDVFSKGKISYLWEATDEIIIFNLVRYLTVLKMV